ncbi:MAG: PAS domain S-box protein, partial [Candidatus Latescibacteria bacterium]|nr:PAS domain S-box protein [Candidatus Latescibacterota bacterium]
DITKRKQAEEALQESEKKYRTIFEQLIDLYYQTDIQGIITNLSPSVKPLTGYDPDELIGRSVLDVYLNPVDRDNFVRELMKSGRVENYELKLVKKTGEVADVSINAHVVLGEDKEPVSIEGVMHDITERKRAEEALKESEAKYRTLFEESTDGIIIADIETKEFLYVNPSMCHMLGYSEEELMALGVGDMHPKEDLEYVISKFEAQAREDKTLVSEIPCLRKDGTVVYADINAAIALIDGRQCSTGFFRDITERRQAEEERQRLEEQIQEARRMESLGVLASGIAHDFNNLLAGVLGNADLALMKLSPVSPACDSVEKIIISARRAADLVSQMLAYAGKGKTIVKPVNLSEVVEEMAHILDTSIPDNAVVEYDLASDLPMVEADLMQVRQVIRNLFNNSMEALGEDCGTITVTTGAVECGPGLDCIPEPRFGAELREGSYVYLQVDDDGCGMDEEIQEKLFDPFFSTKFVGRGLGLPAALGIMRDHGGAISVRSQPVQGTTARILFPVS